MKKKYILIPVAVLAVAGISTATILANDRVKLVNDNLVIEAGSNVNFDINEYINASQSKIQKLTIDTSKVDTSHVGTYEITITYKKQVLTVNVTVQDTVAPVISAPSEPIRTKVGVTIAIESLQVSTEDATPITLSFEDETNVVTFEEVGNVTKKVIATDEAGNKSEVELSFVIADAHAPLISGVSSKTLYLEYDNNLLDGVTASDEEDGDLTDKIKVSEIDMTKEGTTEVTYSVEDASGNLTEESATITLESCIEEMESTMYANTAVNVYENLQAVNDSNVEKLGTLSYAQEVTVTGQDKSSGWYRIDYNGQVGFVSNSYLSDTKPVVQTAKPSTSTSTTAQSGGTQTTTPSTSSNPAQFGDTQTTTPSTSTSTSKSHLNPGDKTPNGTHTIKSFVDYGPDGTPMYTFEPIVHDKSTDSGISW